MIMHSVNVPRPMSCTYYSQQMLALVRNKSKNKHLIYLTSYVCARGEWWESPKRHEISNNFLISEWSKVFLQFYIL